MQRVPLVCAVDDNPAICESLDGLLRSAGFEVRTFTSASAFLQWSASNEPDCVILDFAMPEMNGLEVRKTLLDRGTSIPVIFASGASDEAVWSTLNACGAFAVFAKPLNANALVDAVERAIAERQLRAPPFTAPSSQKPPA